MRWRRRQCAPRSRCYWTRTGPKLEGCQNGWGRSGGGQKRRSDPCINAPAGRRRCRPGHAGGHPRGGARDGRRRDQSSAAGKADGTARNWLVRTGKRDSPTWIDETISAPAAQGSGPGKRRTSCWSRGACKGTGDPGYTTCDNGGRKAPARGQRRGGGNPVWPGPTGAEVGRRHCLCEAARGCPELKEATPGDVTTNKAGTDRAGDDRAAAGRAGCEDMST